MMTAEIGAEARLVFSQDSVRKERVQKRYRNSELDEQLRQSRNRKEAKILAASPVRSPKLLASDAYSITMERIEGKRLRDILDAGNASRYGGELGSMIKALHAADVVHADLTTSNVMVEAASGELVLIDFGLSSTSSKVEDKAVDLHVLKETLEGTHVELASAFWQAFTKAYADQAVLKQLAKVQSRGRYKEKY